MAFVRKNPIFCSGFSETWIVIVSLLRPCIGKRTHLPHLRWPRSFWGQGGRSVLGKAWAAPRHLPFPCWPNPHARTAPELPRPVRSRHSSIPVQTNALCRLCMDVQCHKQQQLWTMTEEQAFTSENKIRDVFRNYTYIYSVRFIYIYM